RAAARSSRTKPTSGPAGSTSRRKYVTTQLIVTTDFLKAHPYVVQKLVNGQVAANDFIHTNTADAETDVSNGIKSITGKAISGDLVIASFKNIDFTNDPIAGQVAANDFIHTNRADAETDVSNGIKSITGKAISGDLVIASFKNMRRRALDSFSLDRVSRWRRE